MNRRFPIFEVLLVAILLITLVACGGGHKSSVVSGTAFNASNSAQDGIVRDSFRLVPQGDLNTESFSLSIEELDSGDIRVDVEAVAAEELPYALFELIYDSDRYSPVTVEFGDFFGDEDVLTAGIVGVAGNVGLGVVPIKYSEKPGVSGTGLIVSVIFGDGPSRSISAAGGPTTGYRTDDVFELTQIGAGTPEDPITGATWPMLFIADGDISGEVGVPDITPIAEHYLELVADHPELDVVDYDGNGEIGVPDITPIAEHYLEVMTGYNVYYDIVDIYDPATATLDGKVTYADMIAAGNYTEGGWLEFTYDFVNLPPETDPVTTWYYFAVPYAGGTTETEAEPSLATTGLEVIGQGGGVTNPPLFNDFTISVIGGDVDEEFLGGDSPSALGIIANESFDFDLVSAVVQLWNEDTEVYDPEITIDDTHAEWDPDWNLNIAWATTATPDAFSFDTLTGVPVVGSCGPDDPYTFDITATLNTRVVTLNVTVGLDPAAPLNVAVEPDYVEFADIPTTTHMLFLNMNDDPAGTEEYVFQLLPTDGSDPIDFVYQDVGDPTELTSAHFFVEERFTPGHDTSHILHFRTIVQAGTFRFGVSNNLGRTSSINHPPIDGTTPTDLMLEVDVGTAGEPIPLRTFPIITAEGMTRVIITPENPRVQKYPAIVDPDDPGYRYKLHVRDEGPGEFFPYMPSPTDPPNHNASPWVRAYTSSPFTGEIFDPDATYIASTAPNETEVANPGNGVSWISDWGVREWNRVVVEVADNDLFPPQPNPDDRYYVVVFGAQADWDNPVPVGLGSFRKLGGPAPAPEVPYLVGIADADLAFDDDRDAVQDSPWPVFEYPTAAGVTFDWMDIGARDFYALFAVGRNLKPDMYFGSIGQPTVYRDSSLILYDDEEGNNLLSRTINNSTVGSEVYLATVKPYEDDTNGGPYTPPAGWVDDPEGWEFGPPVGNAPIMYDDNDVGWMICPLAEMDRLEMLLPFEQTFYVGVGVWNAGAQQWVDSPAPLDKPFTVINYEE